MRRAPEEEHVAWALPRVLNHVGIALARHGKQPGREQRGEVAAAGVAGERDTVGVTAERLGVVIDPLPR